jgi:glycosyltransferase 2 family protein
LKYLRTALQYLVFFGLTAALLVFALRSIETGEGGSKVEFLVATWQQANKWYLFAMFLVAMVSHVVRAIRWQMLLVPVGYKASFSGSFLSLMIGYLVNLAARGRGHPEHQPL